MTASPKKTSSTPATPEAVAPIGEEAPTKVDQIRGLLFGAQREEYDRRFSRLEESLLKTVAETNEKFTARLNAQREEYEKKLARIQELLVENIAQLDDEKLDRATLAKLLQQLMQSSQKLKISGEQKD